jgi:hypothetical protein
MPHLEALLDRLGKTSGPPKPRRENPMEVSSSDGFFITQWLQGPHFKPSFVRAESSFIFGTTDTGKSRLLVRLALMFRKRSDAQVQDAFGAENDSESTAWIDCPETKDNTAFIVGNEVKVDGWDNCIPVAEFTLEKAAKYDVIVTDRSLFGPLDDDKWENRYYAALARLFQLNKKREGGPRARIIAFTIREAWNVIHSQMEAGISRDEQAAMRQFRKLHNQRYHSKVAALIDTQRFTDLSASVRSLTDYRYIKGFGSMPIPDELDFLFKPWLFGGRRDWLVRNTPIDEFILLTFKNGVGRGFYADIPWHIAKGYSPLRQHNIVVTLKPKEGGEVNRDPWADAKYLPSNNDLHRRMIEFHNEGLSYKDIAYRMENEGIPMSWQKVKYHLRGQCSCEVTATQPDLPAAQGPVYSQPANQAKVNPYTTSPTSKQP